MPPVPQIYTWHDATLRELCDLVKEVNPLARQRNARLGFAFVYPDKRGVNVMRQVRCGAVLLSWPCLQHAWRVVCGLLHAACLVLGHVCAGQRRVNVMHQVGAAVGAADVHGMTDAVMRGFLAIQGG